MAQSTFTLKNSYVVDISEISVNEYQNKLKAWFADRGIIFSDAQSPASTRSSVTDKPIYDSDGKYVGMGSDTQSDIDPLE